MEKCNRNSDLAISLALITSYSNQVKTKNLGLVLDSRPRQTLVVK